MEKNFIQCSLNVSFQGQGKLESIKIQAELFHLRREIFCKLYTLSNLVIYTFKDPAGSFLTPNIMWYAQNFQWVQNSIFPIGKFIFPNSFSLINT